MSNPSQPPPDHNADQTERLSVPEESSAADDVTLTEPAVSPTTVPPLDATLMMPEDSAAPPAPALLDVTLTEPAEPPTTLPPPIDPTLMPPDTTRVVFGLAETPETVPPPSAAAIPPTVAPPEASSPPDPHATGRLRPSSGAAPTGHDLAQWQHSRAGTIRRAAPSPSAAATKSGVRPPPRGVYPPIQGYEILGELGRGGMGVVYKAHHRRLNRLVALKMILAGGRAGKAELERFQAEAEAVAQLHHRNIVQIYEIGEQDGLPFIALEFVDGGGLDGKINGKAQLPRSAALIVQQMAEAMQVAHQHGIIHRDLKPANVLLAAGPDEPLEFCVPKITDFGLARRFDDDSSRTRDGSVMGTPSYMSPEQAQGKVRELGPPTDVYALGAVLYDLLTGVPPFRGTSAVDTIRMVVEDNPHPPARLQAGVPRDLQIICLKCLEKEPVKRYQSAGALAEDLRRFLNGEPIQARPVPVHERVWKWCRRNPAVAALIAVSTVALLAMAVGGIAFGVYSANRANGEASLRADAVREKASAIEARRVADTERQNAVNERQIADTEREHAEANFAEARQAVRLLTDLGQNRLANEPHLEAVRQDILRTALSFHQSFLERNANNPKVRYHLGLAHLRVGEIEELLGHFDDAEKAYRDAITVFKEAIRQEGAQRDHRLGLAAAWADLGPLLLQGDSGDAKRKEEANRAIDTSVELYDALHQDFKDSRDIRYQLAVAHNRRAAMRHKQERIPEAEQDYQDALKLLKKLTADHALTIGKTPHRGSPQDEEGTRFTYQQELAHAYTGRGLLWTGRDRKKAEEAYQEAVKLLKPLSDHYPDLAFLRRDLANAYLDRGLLRHRDVYGNTPEEVRRLVPLALTDYTDAEKLLVDLATLYKSVPEYRQLLVNVYLNHGQLLREAARPREAEEIWRLALPLLESLIGDFPKDWSYQRRLGRSRWELGTALVMQNKGPDGIKTYREALADLEPLIPAHWTDEVLWTDYGRTWQNLTATLVGSGVAYQAEAEARAPLNVEVQRRRVEVLPKDHASREDLARSWTLCARLLSNQRRNDEAALALEQAALSRLAAADLLKDNASLSAVRRDYLKKALDNLRQAVDLGYHDAEGLRTRPEYGPLRSDPEFSKLLRRVGRWW